MPREWEVQNFTYVEDLPDKQWRSWRDHKSRLGPLMTYTKGINELIRLYKYINRALPMRLYNVKTGEVLPVELLDV